MKKKWFKSSSRRGNNFSKLAGEKSTHKTETNREIQETQMAAILDCLGEDKHTEEVEKNQESKDPADDTELTNLF